MKKPRKKRSLLPDVLLVAAVVVVAVVATVLVLNKGSGLSTDTLSASFDSVGDRIAFLQKYLDCPSPVEDTEYHIVYTEGYPSTWSIAAVLKVAPADVPAWTDGLDAADTVDPALWAGLPAEALAGAQWQTNGEPEYYRRAGADSWLIAYPEDGILYKYTASE